MVRIISLFAFREYMIISPFTSPTSVLTRTALNAVNGPVLWSTT